MTFELRDFLSLGTTLAGVVIVLVRLDDASKEQTRQHAALKKVVDATAIEVGMLERADSAHGARLDNVEDRVDRVETRVDMIARRV